MLRELGQPQQDKGCVSPLICGYKIVTLIEGENGIGVAGGLGMEGEKCL